jgi:outer membrane protein OmpA-like peptidoglycan-associated protein
MSTPRKLCVFFCVLAFVAICALALTLNTTGRYGFAGRGGIESELVDQAETIIGADAVGAVVTANGRDLTVGLPDVVVASFDRENLTSQLKAIVGVRSVELVGEPSIEVSPDGSGAPEPTAVAAVEPAPTATAEPAPVPTAEPAPVPTAEPTPVPLTLAEVVGGVDLGALSFAPGTSRITAEGAVVLDNIADQLHAFSRGSVQVQAHTDNVGDPDVNVLLSQVRAEAVVTYLIDRGVSASLLTARGFGAQTPIADNSTEQGRAANQRVMLVVEGN